MSSASTPHFTPPPYFGAEENGRHPSRISVICEDLYRAAHRGDWETTNLILQLNWRLRITALNSELETALHVAVGTGKAIHYVQKLVLTMQPDDLEKLDLYGQTPLMVATIIGNIEAAKLLVHKNPRLLYMHDDKKRLPIHKAAQYGQKDILLYLLKVTSRDNFDTFPYADESGARLLANIMEAGFYDVATSLLRNFPQLIDESFTGGYESTPPLTMLAKKPSAFSCMGFWKGLWYTCIPIRWQVSYDDCIIGFTTRGGENLLEQSRCPSRGVRYLTESGIVEIVEELAETFPNLLWSKNIKDQNIFQVAVLCRHQSVYNLVYRIAKNKRYKTREPDMSGNNILHMAGIQAPLHRLNMVSGAAMKMRHELQWFEEVGKSVQPFQRSALNNAGQTPKELFTKEHMNLVKEGEKWMKSTASSCTTPAALIATVVFAAAIAVPSSSNIGILKGEAAFKVFAYADALSLFTALSSLLMFVSVLTSRYTEDEFLYQLPLRILTGLLTLLISISSMMVAFGMILYLIFGEGKKWILSIIVTAAFVPGALFVILHYSLLSDMIFYSRFHQIFGKKGGGRPLYTRPRSKYTSRIYGYRY